jgi:hypothetical protein
VSVKYKLAGAPNFLRTCNQGDQIGGIFAVWPIFYFGNF